MKVIKAFGPADLRIVEAPIPEPQPGYVRIRVRASGICGSDKWIWNVNGPTDAVAGHETAGDVDELGEGVSGLSVGDRVMVNNVGGCGICPACRQGAFVYCPSWNGKLDVNNGFGEYLVAPARNCLILHPSLDYVDGALLMDNWGTPYSAMEKAQLGAGMDVLVSGLGPVGLAAVALLASRGACVVATDPVAARREAASRLGAMAACEPNRAAALARDIADGQGVHAVMECSGNSAAYASGLDALRVGGTFICVGEHAEYLLKPSETLIRRQLRMMGSWYSTMKDAKSLQVLAAQGLIRPKGFLTHTVSLEEMPGIFGQVMELAPHILKCVVAM